MFANVNTAKGHEKGNGTAWTETTLDSGGTVSMTSGRDALLDGAQVSGNAIVADIGRDLLMRSQQDSNDYKSKQNSAAAGAAGAATGELAAKAIAVMLYPDVTDLSKLSEEQKQTVSALATISAGMAGGLAGDSTSSAATGAGAGKNAAENNALSVDQNQDRIKELSQCQGNAAVKKGLPKNISNSMLSSIRALLSVKAHRPVLIRLMRLAAYRRHTQIALANLVISFTVQVI